MLAAVLVCSANAIMRYGLNISSNAWLELQWYMFSAIFMPCAAYTLRCNEHIRIDIASSRLPKTTRDWIDVAGHLLFLIPLCLIMLYEGWPYFITAWNSNEISANAGGLVRWPARFLIVAGFVLLLLQALSELIKRIATMRGWIPEPYDTKPSSH